MIEKFEHPAQRVGVTNIVISPIYAAVLLPVTLFVGFMILAVGTTMGATVSIIGAVVFMSSIIFYMILAEATHEYVIQIRGGNSRTITTKWREL